MAVEILILSGARQGERVVLDETNFRVGPSPDYAVFFDPRVDKSTVDRSASFRLMEDGWYVVHTTGAIYINQRSVAGPTRIRSGDVIRMSESGPDFSFSIVANAASGRTKLPEQTAGLSTVSGPYRDLSSNVAPPVVLAPPHNPVATPVFPPAPSAAVPTLLEQNTTKTGTKDRWMIWVAGGIALCVALAFLMRGPTPTTVNVTLNNPLANNDKKTSPQDNQISTNPPSQVSTSAATPTPTTQQTTSSAPPSQPTKEERITMKIKDAVFLIEVEKAGKFWPFATCSAIEKNTLLTTAREASQLNQWHKDSQKEFKIWIKNPASGIQMAVQNIYVNAVFTTIDDKPNDWIYSDLALLTVAEELPNIIPLASPEEISEGLPVYCCGFTHEGKKITKFSSFQPQLMPGEIYLITAHPNLPSHPRLLHIKGNIFKNAFGSPIVNDQGKLVAVYGETMKPKNDAGGPAGQNGMEIHYATVIDPELINLGIKNNDGKIWVSPDLEEIGAEPKVER